ncbi:AraC family transcriptional regulator [Aquimarina sp. 2201CG5-10]|uniref:helix-turn-helix domain-containing protein n=1 Tax=Aquimarina callyspongiae TaxID=3098150 RepID=UPI002AB51D29|nr:AraC family transcriptional regulator [Aquimarina sp. 2201CG5-10]MDY8137182.1 AraC family transcriptional regulator [Aquimarina sp. 2201CG5-10]
MHFETHVLSSPIDQYIESIFHFKDFIPDHSIERVVPTGHIFIIFELDNIPRNTFDNETLQPNNTYTKVWISGMHKNYISISAHHNSEMFVIQFKPFGAHPFFHFPIHELNQKILPAQEILGDDVINLREDIYAQNDSKSKFILVEKWLKNRFDSQKTPPLDLLQVLETLQQESATNYPAVINKYPNTQKHLIDQCKKYIGLTPKYFQRILRFNEIFKQLQQKEKISWSQIAYQCGYSDQSHFIKEFKHFSGFNPEEFIKQDFDPDEQNFFPLDREG